MPAWTAEGDEMDRKHVVLHWYRHGLRLHDNPALLNGLRDAAEFYPIFIFDGETAGLRTAKYPRMRFLLECLEDLDKSFREHGGRLYCFKGKAVEIFNDLIDELGVTKVTFEMDPEPIWLERDTAVKELLDAKGVEWVEIVSHTLWDPQLVCKANNGLPPHTYKLFNNVTEVLGLPEKPLPDPVFDGVSLTPPASYANTHLVPTLQELAVLPESEEQENPFNRWYGGEKEALRLFKERLNNEKKAYTANVIMPNQLKPDLVGQSRSLSPHLRFGTLSIRKFFWSIRELYSETSKEPATNHLTAQLIWREYFYCMSYQNINYAQMKDNPICLQINWYDEKDKLDKWINSKTGFPWVDAIMVQLRQEGWIHHIARHAIACFVTRGDLWCGWDTGFKMMEPYLLDGDWSVCAGNWMWVSSSAFENCLQCPNCFSPVTFGMRMEPTGQYIRRYLPVLKDMPLKYLYCPWKAPLEVQKKANCVVGEDYPRPMVDHLTASKENKNKMEAIKNRIKDPTVWHCKPSGVDEVQQFICLPKGNTTNLSRCCSSDQCGIAMTGFQD